MNMTPKEKAKELAIKFTCLTDIVKPNLRSKRMALLCVDEILDIIRYHGSDIGKHSLKYWLNVKQEINNV